jgi:hypothetical protein
MADEKQENNDRPTKKCMECACLHSCSYPQDAEAREWKLFRTGVRCEK